MSFPFRTIDSSNVPPFAVLINGFTPQRFKLQKKFYLHNDPVLASVLLLILSSPLHISFSPFFSPYREIHFFAFSSVFLWVGQSSF